MYRPRVRIRNRVAATSLLLSALLICTRPAAAEDREPAYKLSLDLDLPLMLIGGATASSFVVMGELPKPACAPLCDRSNVNFLDRSAAGRFDEGWGKVGDVATISTLLFGPLVVLLDEGLKNGLNDDVVVLESVLLTSAFQVALSYGIERPRPRMYGEDAPLEKRSTANDARSFFSGHTANVFASTVAAARTFQRLGKPGRAWGVLGAGLAGGTAVGISRVLGGSHFPTDVLAGAAAGAAFGLFIPALHATHTRVMPTSFSSGGMGMLVTGVLP